MQISKETIRKVCEAIFAVEDPKVAEAYSAFDQMPVEFTNALALEEYISQKLENPKGLADLIVVYPGMNGRAELKKIELNKSKYPNYKFRYTWDGWGLISVQLASSDLGIRSEISANTEARAAKWASTHPEFGAPSSWNWTEVTKQKNRLSRVLKKYA